MATEIEMLEPQVQDQSTRRSSMEVMCDILEVVSSGTERPTHIINRANVSWKVLNNCLRNLMSRELVSKVNDGKRDIYQLTEKGFSVLHEYKDLRSRLLNADRADRILVNDFSRDF